MTQLLNLYNKRFGKLLVLNDHKRIKNCIQWKCLCDCGAIKYIRSNSLVSGNTASCGCCEHHEHKNRKFNPKDASYRAKASSYKAHAKRRKITWDITIEEAASLLKSDCFYCGSEPSTKFNSIKNRRTYEASRSKTTQEHIDTGEILRNGVDRIHNDLGYTRENSVPCCSFCNFAKNDRSLQDFYAWIDRLIINRSKE